MKVSVREERSVSKMGLAEPRGEQLCLGVREQLCLEGPSAVPRLGDTGTGIGISGQAEMDRAG